MADSVIDALKAIESGAATWWVPLISDLKKEEIRMVQIVDATRRYIGLSWADLKAAGHRRIKRKLLKTIWALSDPGADSPPETYLRLAVRDLTNWTSQREFFRANGARLTAADLADEKSKVALFYDGEHHLHRDQRDYDSDVTQQLRLQGWEPIRITAGQLRNIKELRMRVWHFIERNTR
ncbi:hypothetical protein [Corynebacterium epidermidicanis]|uniref:hypothetical protein n=1 Tax=Corynebacterium epidermidicanis TaxID=1050174 RepID=UPI00130E06C3|nr:hypothetical protein [Corynebacterium epidermidicanis]